MVEEESRVLVKTYYLEERWFYFEGLTELKDKKAEVKHQHLKAQDKAM